MMCIDEISEEDDADSPASTKEQIEPKKAKMPTNHDIIYIDWGGCNSDDENDSLNSTTEQAGSNKPKAPRNHDIICIDETSDDESPNSTIEQAAQKKFKAPTHNSIICIDVDGLSSDDDDDDDVVSSNSTKGQVTSGRSKTLIPALEATSAISSTIRTPQPQQHHHGSEPPQQQHCITAFTVTAFKRPDAKVGIVFTYRPSLCPVVVVVSRVWPDSIFSRHRLSLDGEGGEGPGLEGAEVVAVNGVPVRDPRHAAELARNAAEEVQLTIKRGGIESKRGNNDRGGMVGGDLESSKPVKCGDIGTLINLLDEDDSLPEANEDPAYDNSSGYNATTKAKTTANTATKTTNTKITQNNEGLIWKRLQRILDNKECKDEPAGPSEEENRLLCNVTDFGITPYKFEVPLGNGVSDCVGHDKNNRLCVVEAKCISMKKGAHHRRAKVVEQTTSYAIFLAQETRSDVAAYSFDDQNGLIALQSFGVFEYEKVKHCDPRGKDAVATKFRQNKKRVLKQNFKPVKRKMQSPWHRKQPRGRFSEGS